MEKIEGINLKELVEECEIALKREKIAKEYDDHIQCVCRRSSRRSRARWLQKIFGTKENREEELEKLYKDIENEN